MINHPWETCESCWVSSVPTRWYVPSDRTEKHVGHETKERVRYKLEISCLNINEKTKDEVMLELWVNDCVAGSEILIGDVLHLDLIKPDFTAYFILFTQKSRNLIGRSVGELEPCPIPQRSASVFPRFHFENDIIDAGNKIVATLSYSMKWIKCIVCDSLVILDKNVEDREYVAIMAEKSEESRRIKMLVARANGVIPANTQVPAFDDEIIKDEGISKSEISPPKFKEITNRTSAHVTEYIPSFSFDAFFQKFLNPVWWILGDVPELDRTRLHVNVKSIDFGKNNLVPSNTYILIEIVSNNSDLEPRKSRAASNQSFHLEMDETAQRVELTLIEESAKRPSSPLRRSPSRILGLLSINFSSLNNRSTDKIFDFKTYLEHNIRIQLKIDLPTSHLVHPFTFADISLAQLDPPSTMPTFKSLFEYVYYMPTLPDSPHLLTLEEVLDLGKCPWRQKAWILFQLFVSLHKSSVFFLTKSFLVVTYVADQVHVWDIDAGKVSEILPRGEQKTVVSAKNMYTLTQTVTADTVRKIVLFENRNGPCPLEVRKHVPVKVHKQSISIAGTRKGGDLIGELAESVSDEIKAQISTSRAVFDPKIDDIEHICCSFLSWDDRRHELNHPKAIWIEEIAFNAIEELSIERILRRFNSVVFSSEFAVKTFLHTFLNYFLLRVILLY